MARFEITWPSVSVSNYDVSQSAMNLVRVHVALSSTAGLEDDQWEVVNELARDNLSSKV